MNAVYKTLICLFFPALLIQGCSSPSRYDIKQDHGPSKPVDVSHVSNAVPKVEPRSKYGNPESYEVAGKTYYVMQSSKGYSKKGGASWYGKKFHGHRTSSGETYDMYAMTAAHKTLPLPTYVRVTNNKNKKSVIVKVNDRGPFHEGRIIDLSYAAAHKLGIASQGTGNVTVTAIDPTAPSSQQQKPNTISSAPINRVKPKFGRYLQLGAFSEKYNASKLTKRLSRLFKSSRIHLNFIEDKNLYRVRIGPLASAAEADRLSSLLQKKGIQSSQVIID